VFVKAVRRDLIGYPAPGSTEACQTATGQGRREIEATALSRLHRALLIERAPDSEADDAQSVISCASGTIGRANLIRNAGTLPALVTIRRRQMGDTAA
jgi:hypothetical protein